MRLDKYLSHCGLGTRTQTRHLIKQGVVEVDGIVCKQLGRHIQNESVTVYGEPLEYEAFLYYMVHKPKGILSASKDPKQPTVVELLQGENPLPVHVVGRLDKDTTGLILLTNNGALAHNIISPKTKLPKVYEMILDDVLSPQEIQSLEKGVLLDEKMTLPSKIEHLHGTTYNMTLMEGRFHQIKRMMAVVNRDVVELHRTTIGPLSLDDNLAVGEYRVLSKEEVTMLFEATHLSM